MMSKAINREPQQTPSTNKKDTQRQGEGGCKSINNLNVN